jgi:hypothetical protein
VGNYAQLKKDSIEMKTLIGKFTFKIPEGHPEAGKKIEKPFEFQETTSDGEAQEVMTSKKWSLKEMVDEVLKANARSNAYQAALLPYKPSEVSQDDIKERIVRDFIRSGFSEAVARATVDSMYAAKDNPTEPTE